MLQYQGRNAFCINSDITNSLQRFTDDKASHSIIYLKGIQSIDIRTGVTGPFFGVCQYYGSSILNEL